jgi:hypothetical protein
MIENLIKALQEDKGLYESYKANIAVAFQDSAYQFRKQFNKRTLSIKDIHTISNAAADSFLAKFIYEPMDGVIGSEGCCSCDGGCNTCGGAEEKSESKEGVYIAPEYLC